MIFDLEKRVWWEYLTEDLKDLLLQSQVLFEKTGKWNKKFHDYSFVVFPAAKAYEGFLKKLFLDMGFINNSEYLGKHFRIGKALNPALEKRYRTTESVYDKLATFCNGRELPEQLWKTWKESRNLLFHWFPNEKNAIDRKEAEDRLAMVIDSIDTVFKECKIEK